MNYKAGTGSSSVTHSHRAGAHRVLPCPPLCSASQNAANASESHSSLCTSPRSSASDEEDSQVSGLNSWFAAGTSPGLDYQVGSSFFFRHVSSPQSSLSRFRGPGPVRGPCRLLPSPGSAKPARRHCPRGRHTASLPPATRTPWNGTAPVKPHASTDRGPRVSGRALERAERPWFPSLTQ